MVWMDDKDLINEHEHLVTALKQGKPAVLKREAEKQGKELKEYKMDQMKSKIKHIHIEPADDGGFMTEVHYQPKPPKMEKTGKHGVIAVGMFDPDCNISKHVHANGRDLGKFISDLFPPVSARTKKGKSESQSQDGSHIETFEGNSEGGDVDDEEEEG